MRRGGGPRLDHVRDHPGEDPAPLRSLGLSSRQAAVLQAVCREADTTAAALAALTGLGRPQVSEALQWLELHGLVEITRLRRPHLVSLVADPGPALAGLLHRCQGERERAGRQADAAAAQVRRRAALLSQAPRAQQRRRLPGAGPGADHDLLVARHTYDEVARTDSTTVRYGAQLHPSTATRRLLVLGDPWEQLRRRWAAKGVAVRFTHAELPVLVVADGARARVEVGVSAPGRTGWTFDRAQVGALQQLFELWWTAAAP